MAIDTEKPAVKPAQEAGFDARAEYLKLTAGTRSGGVYMPPARLRALQTEAAKDKTSAEFQRLSWDALRKSITGIVNRVNILNIKAIVPELFNENLVRGKGLFARSIMKAQAASLPFTPVFACLVAIINTKLPSVGELVLTRLVSQFRRSFKRNDKVRIPCLTEPLPNPSPFSLSVWLPPHSLHTWSINRWQTLCCPWRSSFCFSNVQPIPASR
jgi:pre-mRNA-splicing factor CWC22